MGYVGEREELTWSVGCSGAPGAGGVGAPPSWHKSGKAVAIYVRLCHSIDVYYFVQRD